MGCACGSRARAAARGGTGGGGGGLFVYQVTLPTGEVQRHLTEHDARRAVRLAGGGTLRKVPAS